MRVGLLDLCSGAGGWLLGARYLGVEGSGIELALEPLTTAKKAGLDVGQGDVRDVLGSDTIDYDGMTCSPPCTSFSVMGSGQGREAMEELVPLARHGTPQDLRAYALRTRIHHGLVLEPLRVALERIMLDRPFQYLCLEQVPPVLPLWVEVAERLKQYGYAAQAYILRGEEFGLGQTRRRAIMAASMVNRRGLIPVPTHRAFGRPPREGEEHLLPTVTIQDVVPSVQKGWCFRTDRRAASAVRRWDEPAPTIVSGKAGQDRRWIREGSTGWREKVLTWPADSQIVTHAEAGLMQGFPEDWPWFGTIQERNLQIGNAFPPLMALAALGTVVSD